MTLTYYNHKICIPIAITKCIFRMILHLQNIFFSVKQSDGYPWALWNEVWHSNIFIFSADPTLALDIHMLFLLKLHTKYDLLRNHL